MGFRIGSELLRSELQSPAVWSPCSLSILLAISTVRCGWWFVELLKVRQRQSLVSLCEVHARGWTAEKNQ